MPKTKLYSTGSVQRALDHHELTGRIFHVSPPGHGKPRWRVRTRVLDEPMDLTLREAWILCQGLATAERFVRISTGEELQPTPERGDA